MQQSTWRPIFKDERNRLTISNTIDQIAEVLKADNVLSKPGLFSGSAGMSLFWNYRYLSKGNQADQKRSLACIEHALQEISSQPLYYTHCDGIAGIVWSLTQLCESGTWKHDLNEFISEEIDHYLQLNCLRDIKLGKYDFLHASLGPLLYFMSRKKKEIYQHFFNSIITSLYEIADKTDQHIKWKFKADEESTRFNLGLSHGIPSIIAILSQMRNYGLSNPLCEEMLVKSTNWLISQKRSKSGFTLFPSIVSAEFEDQFSRLGWCYGDLGVALGVAQAGVAMQNQKWLNESIDIALHTTKRRDLLMNLVKDAGLCHGAAGIAHIYNRFYQRTQLEEFLHAAIYWYDRTLEFSRSNIGLQTWRTKPETTEEYWVLEHGVLEGVAGIGLALQASISDVEPNWDRSLLIC